MIAALLPVKSPAEAKQRLRAVLDAAERERLARIMYSETLATLRVVAGLDRVVVVSNDAQVLEEAEGSGALTFAEQRQQSHSASADHAAAWCESLGASTVLMVPIDLPLSTAEEFQALLEAAPAAAGSERRPALVIVPSADGTGTNVLLRTPPSVVRSQFGPGSFAAHLADGRRKGVSVCVRRPAGLVFDLDTPADLLAIAERARPGPTWEFLQAIRAPQRASALLGRRAAKTAPFETSS